MSVRDQIHAALTIGAARRGEPPPPKVRSSVTGVGYSKSGVGAADPDRTVPCVYRGLTPIRDERCPTCAGVVTLRVFPCASPAGYGECTVSKSVAGVKGCCGKCPDHRRFPPVTRRHLLYHVYPRTGSRWRERVRAVVRHAHAFDGLKLVAVAVDHTTDPVPEVVEALGPAFEVEVFPNRPDRREVASFDYLFGRASEFATPGDVTVWGHAKGSTRPLWTTCHRWAEIQEAVFLGHLPVVEDSLAHFPVTGAFKKVGRGWADHESRSEWHYSGSWFAVRNLPLFSKGGWNRIDRFWCGMEAYPSLHFPARDSGCVFHTAPVPVMNLYNGRYWHGAVEPEFRRWLADNAAKRTPPRG